MTLFLTMCNMQVEVILLHHWCRAHPIMLQLQDLARHAWPDAPQLRSCNYFAGP